VIVVILSAAKDLMPVASGDEVLRFSADQIRATQDDRSVTEHAADRRRKVSRHTPQHCSVLSSGFGAKSAQDNSFAPA
jgi:hypothetical protein